MPLRISLAITDAAKAALLRILSQIPEARIVSVLWSDSGTRTAKGVTTQLPPSWDVGFYGFDQVPDKEIQKIGGLDFVFVQGPISQRLNGKTLDWKDGTFHVQDNGI